MWFTLAGIDFTSGASPSREDCYIHHEIVTHAITNISKVQGEPEHVASQVSNMLRRTTAVLAAARTPNWANGGTYAARLPWLTPLLESEGLAAKFLCRAARDEFVEFVAAIEASGELIADGELVVEKLKNVLETEPADEAALLDHRAARAPYLVPSRLYGRGAIPIPEQYDRLAEIPRPAHFSREDDAEIQDGEKSNEISRQAVYARPPSPRSLAFFPELTEQL